jgi:hypothetical protein
MVAFLTVIPGTKIEYNANATGIRVKASPGKLRGAARVRFPVQVRVHHRHPERDAGLWLRLGQKPGQPTPGPSRDRFSADVTINVGSCDDAVAGVTSCHDPLGNINFGMSMERLYLCSLGTLVLPDQAFA